MLELRIWPAREIAMTLSIDAIFENGVFVPVTRPALTDHERVRLTVEPVVSSSKSPKQIIQERRNHRIKIDGNLAREIALFC